MLLSQLLTKFVISVKFQTTMAIETHDANYSFVPYSLNNLSYIRVRRVTLAIRIAPLSILLAIQVYRQFLEQDFHLPAMSHPRRTSFQCLFGIYWSHQNSNNSK